MKTIGLIGGTTWLSTVEYYSLINRMVQERLGGSNSAKILLYSLNFQEVLPIPDSGKWKIQTANKFIPIALELEKAGADCILFCANTPHMFADEVQERLSIPLIDIASATAVEIKKNGIDKVALLGTRITMEQAFYKDKLAKNGITVLIPDDNDRNFINNSIFEELGKEIFKPETKQRYLDIIGKMKEAGAKGIILGCTEIPLIIKQTDCDIPLFDTTLIHAKAAVEYALS